MTDSNSQTAEEDRLIEAALALAAYQDIELANKAKATSAQAKIDELKPQLEDAELELIDRDIEFNQARKRLILAKRAYDAAQEVYYAGYQAVQDARKDLWKAANTKDREQILAAARAYNELSAINYEKNQLFEESSREKIDADDALKAASEARKAAVSKRGKLKAQLEAAEAEHFEAIKNKRSTDLFAHESAVVNAACALNGTEDQQVAYSYVYTEELFGLEEPDTN